MQSVDKDMDNTPAESDQIECANCRNTFAWIEAYWQSRTPGSRDAAGYDGVSRAFCPHCGAVVCEGTTSRWKWYGDNQFINSYKALPPTLPPDLEWLPDDGGQEFMEEFHRLWGKRQLPSKLRVPVSEKSLDLSLLGAFEEIPFRRKPARPQKGFLSTLREAYFHEDDYCQIEVLPIGDWHYCMAELQKIAESSDRHSAPVGWNDMLVRDETPQPTASLNINVKDLASSLSTILTPYDRVLTGYSSFREEAERALAFGSETSCIVFADYNMDEIVEDIWLDFGLLTQQDKELALKAMLNLGSISDMLFVDWSLGRIVRLSDPDEIMSYFELRQKGRGYS